MHFALLLAAMLAVGGFFGAHFSSHSGYDVGAGNSAGTTSVDHRKLLCGTGPGCE